MGDMGKIIGCMIILLIVVTVVDIDSIWKCVQNSCTYKKINNVLTSKRVSQTINKIKAIIKLYMNFIKEKIKSSLPSIKCGPYGIIVKKPDWLADEPWYSRMYRNIDFLCKKKVVECFCPEVKKESTFKIVKEKIREIIQIWKEKLLMHLREAKSLLKKGFDLLILFLGYEIELDLDKCQEGLIQYLMNSCNLRRVCPDGNIKVAIHLKEIYTFYFQMISFIIVMIILLGLHLILIIPKEEERFILEVPVPR